MPVQKVTDPKRIVTDSRILAMLDHLSIDKDYVEMTADYGQRIKGVSSPHAKFYRHLESNLKFQSIMSRPRAMPTGEFIEDGWTYEGGVYKPKLGLYDAAKLVAELRSRMGVVVDDVFDIGRVELL